MISKLTFRPNIPQRIKRTAMACTVGLASLTAGTQAQVIPPSGGAVSIRLNAVNAANREKSKIYTYEDWQRDSVKTVNEIEEHSSRINKLKQELEAKKAKIGSSINEKKASSGIYKDIQIGLLSMALVLSVITLIDLISIHKRGRRLF